MDDTGSQEEGKREAKEYLDKVISALKERKAALVEVDGELEELKKALTNVKVGTGRPMRAGSLAAGAAFGRKTKEKISALEEKRQEVVELITKAEERLEFAKEDLAEFE